MAKVNEEAKKKYFELIAPYKKIVSDLNDAEQRIETILKGSDPGEAYKRLALAEDNLTVVSYYLVMNSLSVSLLGIRSDTSLNEARRACYKAIIQLEKVFTDYVDVPFGEYEENLKGTSSFPEMQRYALIRKTGLAINLVKTGFGEDTKWKYSLVELEARLATVAKNTLDLKTLVQGMDIRAEGYKERIEYFNLVRKQLEFAASEYRLKYEVGAGRSDDFRKATNYLGALMRLSRLLGRQNEANTLKRKIDIWKQKLDADLKNSEAASRQQRLGRGTG